MLVNRFWMHHFGHGLVATPTDFGMRGEGPSHPELLDWIAADFMRGGWELKRLHRMIVTAAAYRQVSTRREELEAIDPDNRLLGRMHVHRLEAETLRDSLLALAGLAAPGMDGEPLYDILEIEDGQEIALASAAQPGPPASAGERAYSEDEEAQIVERLRDLGYE